MSDYGGDDHEDHGEPLLDYEPAEFEFDDNVPEDFVGGENELEEGYAIVSKDGQPVQQGPNGNASGDANAAVGQGKAMLQQRKQKIPNEKRTTTPYMTKYERARVLGTRALQISMNAPILVDLEGETDPLQIALKELNQKKIPLIREEEGQAFSRPNGPANPFNSLDGDFGLPRPRKHEPKTGRTCVDLSDFGGFAQFYTDSITPYLKRMGDLEKEAEGICTSSGDSESSPATPPQEPRVVNASGYNNDEDSFDHGWKAWVQVLAAFFLFFNTWGIVTSFGVFQTYYQREILQNESPSTISWIGSTQACLLLFIGTLTGPLFDAGYTRQLLIAGWLMIPFGLMMTSISTKFWQILLAQAFCVGLGCGCVFIPCVAILPQYFKKRRALANGFAASGSSMGGILYPIIFRQLQLKIGFPWAIRTLGFMTFVTVLVSICFLRVRFQPEEKRSLIQLSALKDPVFTLFALSQFIGFLGLYNMFVYVQPYAIENGIMEPDLAFYLLAMLNASSTFGRIIPNFFADFVGGLNVMIPVAIASGIMSMGWIGANTSESVITMVVIYGFCSGAFVSVPPVVLISITPDLRDFGTRLGMAFVFCAAGSLIGTPIGGAIIQSTNNYLGVKLLSGICLFCSAILMTAARLIKTGPRFLVKA
ncbi:hypothetical protein FQN57_002030 [Myotisia sp. PD_48]|nr:hypothetical protein FQN57_002030 [Myotisia sp. PD_48]